MKTLASILAGAVLAGLIAFYVFDALNTFQTVGNRVSINLAVFVGFIATIAILGAAFAVGIRTAIRRNDERLVHRLEQRLHALESAATTPAPPVVAPADGPAN